MNKVFKGLLQKFMLVFFDDILVYSHSIEEHCSHLRKVLGVDGVLSNVCGRLWEVGWTPYTTVKKG